MGVYVCVYMCGCGVSGTSYYFEVLMYTFLVTLYSAMCSAFSVRYGAIEIIIIIEMSTRSFIHSFFILIPLASGGTTVTESHGLAVGISLFLFIICTVIGIVILRWVVHKGYLRHVARSYKSFCCPNTPVSFDNVQLVPLV